MTMGRLGFGLVLLAALSGCSKPEAPAGAAQASSARAAAMSLEQAMETVYGNYDAKTKASNWKAKAVPAQGVQFYGFDEGAEMRVSPILGEAVAEGGTERFYLAVGIVPLERLQSDGFTCLFCAPAIGATVLAKRDGRWEVESHDAFVTKRGALGKPPAARLVAIGPAIRGFVLSEEAQGPPEDYTSISLVAALGGRMTEQFGMLTSLDNSEYCNDAERPDREPCHEKYTAGLAFRPGTRPDRFDIVVTPNNRAFEYWKSLSGTQVFRFDGKGYQSFQDGDKAMDPQR